MLSEMLSRIIQKRRRRRCAILRTCAVVAVFICTLGSIFIPTVGAQTSIQSDLSDNEKREAQQLSVTFTKRLGETLDLGIVMNELFLPDPVERYLAVEKRKLAVDKNSDVTLWSGIFVDVGLLEKATPKDWRRLYVETNNFFLLGLIHAVHRNTDFEHLKPTDLYPREVIELLDHDPMLSNLILKKSSIRNFKSIEEMRSATITLEKAVTLMRKALPGNIDLEKALVQMAMNQSVKRPINENDLEKARAEVITPRLEVADNEYFGFPKGTRMIFVPTFALHELVLAKVDGRLRIVWAYPNPGD